MVEVELTHQQVDLLFASLKQAETKFTDDGNFKACKDLSKMYESLRRQIFTYGQVD